MAILFKPTRQQCVAFGRPEGWVPRFGEVVWWHRGNVGNHKASYVLANVGSIFTGERWYSVVPRGKVRPVQASIYDLYPATGWQAEWKRDE